MYWLKSLPADIPLAEWTREEDEEVLALEKKYFGRWEDVPYALSHTPYECAVRCFELSQPHFRDYQSISVSKKKPPPKIVMLPEANSAALEPTPTPTPGIDAPAMAMSPRDAWESIFNPSLADLANDTTMMKVPGELFDPISQALQATVDRDCLNGWGAHVNLAELAKDFAVDGTASKSLYGDCESVYKPEMEPEELFETISQALQASVDRDCLSGWGAHVYLVTPTEIKERILKGRMD